MNPTELTTLFSAKEQTLLVATEPKRLAEMSEDELGDLLTLVRRARNKYSGLHRRQGGATVPEVGRRAATQSQNLRTLRKAEIFEDALARVSRSLSAAAKASAAALKAERLAMASAASGSPFGDHKAKAAKTSKKAGTAASTAKRPAPTTNTTKAQRGVVAAGGSSAARTSSSKAQGARRQAKKDGR